MTQQGISFVREETQRDRRVDSVALASFKELLSNEPTPPYYNLLSFQRRLSRIPIFVRSLLAGPVLYFLFYYFTFFLTGEVPEAATLCMVFLGGIISSILVLTSNCYQKSVETMEHISGILTNDDQIKELRRDFTNIFLKRTQVWFSIVFSIVITCFIVPIGLTFSAPVSVILYVFMALGLFIAGFMVWMSFSALFWSIKMGKSGPYRLNNFPSKTLGIRKLSRLIGTFSLSFSLALSLVLIFFYIAPWESQHSFNVVESSIVYPFIVFALVFIFLPQMSIRKIIVQEKERLLVNLESKLIQSNILNSEFADSEYEKYSNITDLHSKIFATSDFALDIGTIGKFFSSLALPIALALLQQPRIFEELFSSLK
jgi:hypothetical protein